ncbi:MAG: hypothetical protein OXG53_03810 [Chloroflexi bacterium]|nr:hypothetical protein [Chloroflexota bacterium]
MMMKPAITTVALLCALWTICIVSAEDGEENMTPYFQSRAFNVPILAGWGDQSGEDFAQFQLAEAEATIRAAIVPTDDIIAAVGAELSDAFEIEVGQPSFQGKVNLADGTWSVLIYDYGDATTASVMARLAAAGTVVISFVEQDPAARTALLIMAQTDDALDDPTPEIAIAVESIAGVSLSELNRAESIRLPSGEWTVYTGASMSAMGMVFGNDSYVALREGAPGDLAALADAYNRTLLGFFITPDNSHYLALGLAVVFVVFGALVGSLFWRERSLRKELALLAQLAGEDG